MSGALRLADRSAAGEMPEEVPAPLALALTLPLPPPDNHCHRSGAYGRYPTAAYKEWLSVAAPLLREALGDREPDTERWWMVTGIVAMGGRGDAQNLIKPVLDLLSGAQVDEAGRLDETTGKRVGKGAVVKLGALWDDDGRVAVLAWKVRAVKHPEPHVELMAWPTEAPEFVRRAKGRAGAQNGRGGAPAAPGGDAGDGGGERGRVG